MIMNMPAFLLIHGYPFDHTLWDHVAGLLRNEYQVLTPDLRGFGGPPVEETEPSLDQMADDMVRVMDEAEVGRAIVGGMSMGGYVALAMAERYRDRIAGLALISSQTKADTEEARSNRRRMMERIRAEGPDIAAKTAIPKLFAASNSEKPELIRFPMKGAAKGGNEGLCWALEAMARRPDRTAVAQALTVPILIIHGAEDQFVPIDTARSIAQELNAELEEIPHAGHGTPIEAPQPVADALRRFAAQCSP